MRYFLKSINLILSFIFFFSCSLMKSGKDNNVINSVVINKQDPKANTKIKNSKGWREKLPENNNYLYFKLSDSSQSDIVTACSTVRFKLVKSFSELISKRIREKLDRFDDLQVDNKDTVGTFLSERLEDIVISKISKMKFLDTYTESSKLTDKKRNTYHCEKLGRIAKKDVQEIKDILIKSFEDSNLNDVKKQSINKALNEIELFF